MRIANELPNDARTCKFCARASIIPKELRSLGCARLIKLYMLTYNGIIPENFLQIDGAGFLPHGLFITTGICSLEPEDFMTLVLHDV